MALYGNQCVDLICYYYQYLGQRSPGGNGADYSWNALPSGWQRLQGVQPQKGDILVYSGNSSNPYGHVAIYAADRETYHQTLIHILMWKKLHTDIMVWATVIGVLFVRTGAKQFPIILKTLCHRMCPIQQRICMRKSVLPILQNVDMSWGNRAAPCR